MKGHVPGLDKDHEQTLRQTHPYGTSGRWWEFPGGNFIFDMDLDDEFSIIIVWVQSKKGMLEKSEPAEPHKTTSIMTTEPLKAPQTSGACT